MPSAALKMRWFVGSLLLAGTLSAAEPAVERSQLPRVPPTQPAQALRAFQVRDGFNVEIAAAEPELASPIAMAFDEESRLYVVEMRDYSERRDEKLGRIRLLEDLDGDGRFEKAAVFAEGLGWPTAVACASGGILVGCTPDVWFLKDTDNDGRADQKTLILTGFADGVERLNVQGLLNSFNWGLDNRIHGATGLMGGRVSVAGMKSKDVLDLRGKDFSFDPRTLDLRAESGGAQHGLSFDSFGNKFVCSNSSHIQAVMYEQRYAGRSRSYAMPPPVTEIAADGGAAEVFRISPDEPWRVLRTRWRVAGLVGGPIEGGGRPSGYFTGATGVTIYTGDAWPAEFVGNAFVGDAGGNLIHRKVLQRVGAGWRAERAPDERKREFLASPDNWFRPIQFGNGPDGNLYVIDMYREVIEHPWSLPQSIKQHLDLDSGRERGRIYRITRQDSSRRPWPRLSRATTEELVKLLDHPNGWHRQTASRLLHERQDPNKAALLGKMLQRELTAAGRVHVLNALHSIGALHQTHLLQAMDHPDANVRRWGIRLTEETAAGGELSQATLRKLVLLAGDADASVRYQLALTLSLIEHPQEAELLSTLAQRDAADSWISAAVVNAAAVRAMDIAAALTKEPQAAESPGVRRILAQLVGIGAESGRRDEVSSLLAAIARSDADQAVVLAAQVFAHLGNSTSILQELPAAEQILDRARVLAADAGIAESTRVDAIRVIGFDHFARSGELLLSLLEERQSAAVQRAAVAALDRFTDRAVAIALCARYAQLAPSARRNLVAQMVKRPERAVILLRYVWGGVIAEKDLTAEQLRQLQNHADPNVRLAMGAVYVRRSTPARREVIARYSPALSLKGDTERGRAIFKERCATCHRLGGEGFPVGPDLLSVRTAGKERLLESIIDPSREAPANFLAYKLDTRDGEAFVGILVSEDVNGVTLRQAGGVEERILSRRMKSLRRLDESLMPENLEEGLSLQDMANLLEFLVSGPQ